MAKRIGIAVLVSLMLVACRDEKVTQADRQLLWDRDGCGYYVRPGMGDTSFVTRVASADKPRCGRVE